MCLQDTPNLWSKLRSINFIDNLIKGVIIMGFTPDNIKEWNLDNYEIAKTCEEVNTRSSSFKVYIPKLMPLINAGKPIQAKQFISPSIFANSDECKPAISTTITTQNFKTLQMADNENFSRTILPYNAEVQIEVTNNNPDSMFITSKIDNSEGEYVSNKYNSEISNANGSMTLYGIPTENGTTSATVQISDLTLTGTNIEKIKE